MEVNKEISIIGRRVRWSAFSFSSPFARIFFCNGIQFVNNGTSTVTINDVFTLNPGDSQSLNCDQNEIDVTVYKVNFGSTGINILQIFIKENMGQSGIEVPLTSAKANVPDRRAWLKKYAERFKKNSDF